MHLFPAACTQKRSANHKGKKTAKVVTVSMERKICEEIVCIAWLNNC